MTIIQSMPDETHAFELLSGKSLPMNSTNPHYDETVQWRKAKVQGVVQSLFLVQRGVEHIMDTELLSSPLSTHASRQQINPTVGSGQRAATAVRPRVTPPSAAGAPSAGPLAPQASAGQYAGLGQKAISDNTRGRVTDLRQRAKFLQLQGQSPLGLWPRKLHSPPAWEKGLFQATLGARARHLLHPSQRYWVLRVAEGYFVAQILAPTLWILDPSKNNLWVKCTRKLVT